MTSLLLRRLRNINNMKRILSLISTIMMCFLCIIMSIFICEAKTVLHFKECGTVLGVFGSNDENIYILCENKNNYQILTIDSSLNTSEKFLDINVQDKAFAYSNNIFYFFSQETEGDANDKDSIPYILVDIYDCFNNAMYKKVINYANPNIHSTFAVDSQENYYMVKHNTIEVYTSNCKYLKTMTADNSVINLSNSYNGEIIYISYDTKLIIISDGTEYSYNIESGKIYPEYDGYFATEYGEVYRFDNENLTQVYTGFDGTHGFAVVGENTLGIKNGELTAVRDNKEILIEDIDDNAYICSLGNKCCCIVQNENDIDINIFDEEDIKNSEVIIDSSVNMPITLTSDIYQINFENNTLTGIIPESTVAAVKERVQGGELTFYDSSGNIKSGGKVGTGNIIESKELGSRLCVIVYGELSGEGNINSSDKKALVNHILNKQTLSDVYLEAADINGDTHVDLKDYVAIDRFLKGEYEINQKRR